MVKRGLLVIGAFVLSAGSISSAAISFNDDFDIDHTANWTVNKGGNAGFSAAGQIAEFNYDYSALGIPSAPNSVAGSTRGLRLRANTTGGVFSGLSVSPNLQHFSAPFTISFDFWGNYIGSNNASGIGDNVNASGSTQLSHWGFGTAGASSQWVGGVLDGEMFGITDDGGTTNTDYRAYIKSANQAASTGAYSAGTTAASLDNLNSYYSFMGTHQAPTVQQNGFGGVTQKGTTPAGTPSFAWHFVQIANNGTFLTEYVDNVRIANVLISSAGTMGGDNIFLAQSDTNNGSTTQPELTFGLFDNLTVSDFAVPEPSALALLAVSVVPLIRRRRRA